MAMISSCAKTGPDIAVVSKLKRALQLEFTCSHPFVPLVAFGSDWEILVSPFVRMVCPNASKAIDIAIDDIETSIGLRLRIELSFPRGFDHLDCIY
jgi:hypothetical protein